jgi:hypothetical protein
MDTLAVRLAVPLIGPAKVFHLLGLRPAGRTKKTAARVDRRCDVHYLAERFCLLLAPT